MLKATISRFCAIITLSFCVLATQAQYVTNTDTSAVLSKNIIGLHINAPLSVMMSSTPGYLQLGTSYKRQITDYKRLVLQANWIPTVYDNNDELFIIGSNDSLLIYESRNSKSNDYLFGVGVEWADYTKRISPYYGVDLLLGYGASQISSQYYKARRNDNEYYVVFNDADTVYYSTAKADYLNASLPGITKEQNFTAGAAFTLGCRIELKSRFEVWAQLTPRLFISHRQLDYENQTTGRKSSFDTTDLEFQLRLLQVLFAYKF
jgi:hypothetical protein